MTAELEARIERLEERVKKLEKNHSIGKNRFVALSEDFNGLRNEINNLEQLIDRRT